MGVESDANVTPNNFTFSPKANLAVDIPLTCNLVDTIAPVPEYIVGSLLIP